VSNPLSRPGEPVALGEALREGESSCGGGEMVGP
jgi:hypothetical protein